MSAITAILPNPRSSALIRGKSLLFSVPQCLRGRFVLDFPITAMSAITRDDGDSS